MSSTLQKSISIDKNYYFPCEPVEHLTALGSRSHCTCTAWCNYFLIRMIMASACSVAPLPLWKATGDKKMIVYRFCLKLWLLVFFSDCLGGLLILNYQGVFFLLNFWTGHWSLGLNAVEASTVEAFKLYIYAIFYVGIGYVHIL